jgi:hypothetical protein
MAYVVRGRKYKKASTVLDKCIEAGAKSARFTQSGTLEVEWPAGVESYSQQRVGDDVLFDIQLDYDLKAA